ncbi:hypothetical protein ACFWDI_09020 [Streptomyces sp. NPDC060064]|uniref:hypothetical protein n=1 Tax=Streptomyces sp. NPDC060064 TaxID=3347049 RepID=UPI0036AB90A3
MPSTTPGARELIDNLTDNAGLPAGPRRIAIGCADGIRELVDRQLLLNLVNKHCR